MPRNGRKRKAEVGGVPSPRVDSFISHNRRVRAPADQDAICTGVFQSIMRSTFPIQFLIGISALAATAPAAQMPMVRLPAAETDRAAQAISWRMQAGAREIRGAKDDRGRMLPVQKGANGELQVVVP